MCYVRGQAHMKLGDTAKAKACFKEALIVDVKCYNVSYRRVFGLVGMWFIFVLIIYTFIHFQRRWMHCCLIICLRSIWVGFSIVF
jgi:hypothetical protein